MAEGGTKSTQCCGNSAKNANSSLRLLCIFYNFRNELVDVFREKDLDLDGKMSLEEFYAHESRTELAFKAIDKNRDGFVSKAEFKRICPNMSREQMEVAFAKFDKDKTGRINYAEFCKMLNKKH